MRVLVHVLVQCPGSVQGLDSFYKQVQIPIGVFCLLFGRQMTSPDQSQPMGLNLGKPALGMGKTSWRSVKALRLGVGRAAWGHGPGSRPRPTRIRMHSTVAVTMRAQTRVGLRAGVLYVDRGVIVLNKPPGLV